MLSFQQHPVQPVTKTSSKWRHFCLSVYGVLIRLRRTNVMTCLRGHAVARMVGNSCLLMVSCACPLLHLCTHKLLLVKNVLDRTRLYVPFWATIYQHLTRLPLVPHICVSELGQHWLLSIGLLGTTFSEIQIRILLFSFKMHLKLSSVTMAAILSRGRWVNQLACCLSPAGTWRNGDVIITLKRRGDVVLT